MFITIATFTYPTELAVVKVRLEDEGIEFRIKDEITAQVHNFISNAIGGIKLQVREDQVKAARQIMTDAGYKFVPDQSLPEFWMKLDKLTSCIPVIKRWKLEYRFLGMIIFFSLIILLIYYFLT